jgi:cysteine-rich repeat protein
MFTTTINSCVTTSCCREAPPRTTRFTMRHLTLSVATLSLIMFTQLGSASVLPRRYLGAGNPNDNNKENGEGSGYGLTCGNGVLDDREECDDGNNDPQDGCLPSCKIQGGWKCHDDNGHQCKCFEICGDGINFGTSECDDGNTKNGDG